MDKKTLIRTNNSITLAQQSFDILLEEIINGTLKPGTKLKVQQIAQQFRIGQSPIREALSRLVASGFVVSEDHKGFRVAEVSEEYVRDIYAIFTQVEIMALRLAMQEGDADWEALIVAELYKLSLIENKKDVVSDLQWIQQNYNFHVALIMGCKSEVLLDIRKNLYMKFDRFCHMAYQMTKHCLPNNYQEHKKLAEAVLERNRDTAEELMKAHINKPLEDVIKKLKIKKLLLER